MLDHRADPGEEAEANLRKRDVQGAGDPTSDAARAETPTEGQSLELEVERLAGGGDGVAHAPDGRVVFVPFTVPGDLIRARVREAHKSWLRAEVVERLADGPDRVEPACEAFGECGGCAWQHIAYPAQCTAKRAILRDALERIGRLALPGSGEIVLHPSPEPYAHRARARLLASGGVVGFRRLRSNDPCPTSSCPVLLPALESERRRLASASPRDGEWELAVGDDGKTRCHDLGIRGGPPISIHAPATADTLQISPGVFAQAHGSLRTRLGEVAIEAAGEGLRLLELYCGAGFLTLGLARRFEVVEALESDALAVADLRENLKRAGVRNVRSIRDRVEHWLRRDPLPRFDTVVLDPPRAGLPRGVAERLAEVRARRIVYVSCDPATLARDLRILAAEGYALTRAEGFDLFPQTPHVEAVAVMELP